MGLRRSRVPRICSAAHHRILHRMSMIFWTGAVITNYRRRQALFSRLFAFPVSYELTILFTAFARSWHVFPERLPMHYHPVLKYEHIRRA